VWKKKKNYSRRRAATAEWEKRIFNEGMSSSATASLNAWQNEAAQQYCAKKKHSGRENASASPKKKGEWNMNRRRIRAVGPPALGHSQKVYRDFEH
jgi:hypothetical protein